jgi:hypothetical protein
MDQVKKRLAPGIDFEGKKITFELMKSNHFRVIHADGIFGGLNPKGNLIRMAFYSERWPIPKKMVHSLTENGQIQEEIQEDREVKEAIIRELEIEVVMDISTATSVLEWLQTKLEAIKKAREPME